MGKMRDIWEKGGYEEYGDRGIEIDGEDGGYEGEEGYVGKEGYVGEEGK